MASDSPVGDLPPVGPSPPKTDDKPKKRKCGDPELPFTHVDYQAGPRGQGYKVTARPLTQCAGNTQGSPPSPSVYAHQFACIAGAGQTGSWVRAHLLHGKTSGSVGDLHGPGNRTWNLIIADKSLNGGMSKRAELPAIAAVYAANRVLWYESTVDGYVPGRDFFAEAVTVRWGLYDPVTKTPGPAIVSERFPRKKDPPNCP